MIATRVCSFDVFDTVITRITAEPTGIFGLIQQKMIDGMYKITPPDFLKNNYAEIRIDSEKLARKNANKEEVTIDQIYEVIFKEYNTSKETIQKIINIEIEEEINSIYGISKIIQRIKDLRHSGMKIIFISDTYLPTRVIRDMLMKVKAYEKNDPIYTSSEIGLTKASGNLFRYVLEHENCNPKQLVHTGDSVNVDVKSGHKVGISVEYFLDTQLNVYEKALLGDEEKRYCDLQGQLTAGISRISRLNKDVSENDRDNVLFDIGANLAGPTLIPYVIWVLSSARSQELKRLYFISRDGQILLEIAKIINEGSAYDLELRYLHGSRQAWHISSAFEIGDRELNWILLQDVGLNIEIVANRIGIDTNELLRTLDDISEKNWSTNTIISAEEISFLKNILSQNPVKDMILAEAENRRELMLSYLIQEKFLEDSTSGIVDIGWHGNIQTSLRKIIDSCCEKHKIIGWYFGLINKNNQEKSKMYGFFFDPDDSYKANYTKNPFYNFMEMFTTGDHGMTISYKKTSKGNIIPVLKEQTNPNLIEWGLTRLREGIFTYTKLYRIHIDGKIKFDFSKYQKRILNCMNILAHTPTLKEADALGSYLFTSDQSENKLLHFAPRFSIVDSIQRCITRKYPSTYWIECTYIRSKKLPRFILSVSTLRFDLLLFKIRKQ